MHAGDERFGGSRFFAKVAVPWLSAHARTVAADLGTDPWIYGADANRVTLERMLRYAAADGLSPTTLTVDASRRGPRLRLVVPSAGWVLTLAHPQVEAVRRNPDLAPLFTAAASAPIVDRDGDLAAVARHRRARAWLGGAGARRSRPRCSSCPSPHSG